MIINKRKIRNIDPYIRHIETGKKLAVGINDLILHSSKLVKMGLPELAAKGQSILPPGIFGPTSRFNSEGKELVHKDQEMETAYRQAEWHWTEWHGPYEQVEQSKIVDVPYKRYPRSFLSPPSIELTVYEGKDGTLILLSPFIENTEANRGTIVHMVNLVLEIFGECQFFSDNLESLIKAPLIRLNWEVLPQGRMPWDQLKQQLKPIIEKAPKGNQVVIEHRLEEINAMNPDFTAVGRGGFYGYIIHGFSDKNVFVLESIYYGNATYVFGEKWEDLSKLTKADILNEKLQKDRIIHREGWETRIRNVVNQAQR